MSNDREQQGLRRPFTREEIGKQQAVKGMEKAGTEAHKRAEQKLADMQNRPASYDHER